MRKSFGFISECQGRAGGDVSCHSSAFWQAAPKDNAGKAGIFISFLLLLFLVSIWDFFFISLFEKEYLGSLLTAELRAQSFAVGKHPAMAQQQLGIGWWQ